MVNEKAVEVFKDHISDSDDIFGITTKRPLHNNGILIEPGMSVEIVSPSFSNFVTTNRSHAFVDAFYRIYGFDIKRGSALSMVHLNIKQI